MHVGDGESGSESVTGDELVDAKRVSLMGEFRFQVIFEGRSNTGEC